MGKEMKRRSRKVFVKPASKRKQPTVDHITGEKIPKSFVFSRGKIPAPLKQLEMDIRKLMLPYTALKLKEKRRNKMKDFLNVAGPLGVTHFLMLSKTDSEPNLRVARTPQGPTITFKVKEYSLAADIARSQKRPRCPQSLFENSPLILLSGFATGEQHLKLITIMFQNIFPTIDVNTVKPESRERIVLLHYNKETKLIDFRHYSIRLRRAGVSPSLSKLAQSRKVPDLRSLQDVSEFITNAGCGSESEADDEAPVVSLSTTDLNRVNQASGKRFVPVLQEIGPRMTLQLMKIEEGLCSGGVMFSEYGGNPVEKRRNETDEGEGEDDGETGEDMEDD